MRQQIKDCAKVILLLRDFGIRAVTEGHTATALAFSIAAARSSDQLERKMIYG